MSNLYQETKEMEEHPCLKADRETELKRKEDHLNIQEKELLLKQKQLQKKVNEFNKKRDTKAKADLKAAKKLNLARRKLQLAVDATNKIEKHRCRKSKCANCETSQCKWFNKIQCSFQKFRNNNGPCFCRKRRDFKDMCELYLKKIVGNSCTCEEVGRNCSTKRFSCHELPYIPKRYSSLESAAGDCYKMAMGRTPNMWAYHPWPVFYPTNLDFRTQCRNLGVCLLFLASFLFWTPCLLCLLLCKCLCCSSCSDCC